MTRVRTSAPSCLALALVASAAASAAFAADDVSAPTELPPLTVIAATPLPGAPLDVAKAPYEVSTVQSADVSLDGPASATGALVARIGAVNINDDLDDTFQPDILYRGFEASPVLGTPEGLAVYQNGVRINEAFGDVVNWDLIADPAIARIDVVGSNPVYGLNALGGAVVISMKNGFDDPGGSAMATGGSFNARSAELIYGAHDDRFAVFVAARAFDQDGWRELSTDSVRQVYADFAARSDRLRFDLSIEAADNQLHGESATPVQELAVSRALVFTSPQENDDHLAFLTLKGSYQATQTLSLQGDVYVRRFDQSVQNGNTTDDEACAAPGPVGQLCQSDGATPLVSTTGAAIPDISAGGTLPIGENDLEQLERAQSVGGSLQRHSTSRTVVRSRQPGERRGLDRQRRRRLRRPRRTGRGGRRAGGAALAVRRLDAGGPALHRDAGQPLGRHDLRRRLLHRHAGSDRSRGHDRQRPLQHRARRAVRPPGRRAGRGQHLRSFRPGGRPHLSAGVATDRLRRLCRGQPCAHRERDRVFRPDQPLPAAFLAVGGSAQPQAGRVAHGRSRDSAENGLYLGAGQLSRQPRATTTDRGAKDDDDAAAATSLGAGFFQNIPGTLRQGGEFDLGYQSERLSAALSYAYVDATFSSALTLPSASSPFSDPSGDIQVTRGDHLPGIPRNRLKLDLAYRLTSRLRIGASAQVVDDQFLSWRRIQPDRPT